MPKAWHKMNRTYAKQLYDMGLTDVEIALKTGASVSTVERFRQDERLPSNSTRIGLVKTTRINLENAEAIAMHTSYGKYKAAMRERENL